LFHEVRRAGNAASHELHSSYMTALSALKMSWQLGLWFHRTFAEPAYSPAPFVPPPVPKDAGAEVRAELERLAAVYTATQPHLAETTLPASIAEDNLLPASDDQAFWEQIAAEAETAGQARYEHLAAQQSESASTEPIEVTGYVTAANAAAALVQLDETETRKLIDEQLRQAGWQADSATLRYALGTRPEKGKNLAIAEWPTMNGPADYVLFVGLTPVAVVEAKRRNIDVSAALPQAKRYSRGFNVYGGAEPVGGPWGKYRLPFAFSANGRPYLRQLQTLSGIWFCDLRRPINLSRALDGWYTPEGLMALLKQDEEASHAQLARTPLIYDFSLRPYQKEAILAIEAAIAAGQRSILVAMATGVGKTKLSIALVYRLLRAQRFRRILFLVDRSALGEQAANAFKDTRIENMQTFADIFGIKELADQAPDSETTVHIATVQGMVQRLLYAGEGETALPIDLYDCIVVDECHRGYLLDRELSEAELSFRSQEEYISKYRRVIEYFDAVKIGLTATPALHTVEIFGRPVYTYSYRDAVIDGYLADHEPPIQLTTYLAAHGITWEEGDEVMVYDAQRNQIDLVTAPDEIRIDLEGFNRKVITEAFNRVVCEYLAQEIDPFSPQKTLIFCLTDRHADMVVNLLKLAFQARYPDVVDDAVAKITGAADRPLALIRRYQNELNPTVAVTVDLLTTGIDVPQICNLVFLRRVNSRILFEQMMGRATRLCPEVGKETFRIFDAVQMYTAMQSMTEMRPVVADPQISFTQLVNELAQLVGDEERALVRDQFIAKLHQKKHRLHDDAARDFETVAGMAPNQFIAHLQTLSLQEVGAWFAQNSALGEILDRLGEGQRPRVL
ncbi:MAG: type I restriction-modification system endonuclease, partial [Caldilinea sp.]